MPANFNPVFTLTPNQLPAICNVANTASDGSGTITTLVTAGANGTRVDQVVFRNGQASQAASSAMLGKIFVSDASGANFRLVGEVLIPATTRSTTVLGATATFTFTPAFQLKSGQLMGVAISVYAGVQDLTSVVAYGGDY